MMQSKPWNTSVESMTDKPNEVSAEERAHWVIERVAELMLANPGTNWYDHAEGVIAAELVITRVDAEAAAAEKRDREWEEPVFSWCKDTGVQLTSVGEGRLHPSHLHALLCDATLMILANAREQNNREWSANLESGYCDCPPRTPDEIGAWWPLLLLSIRQSVRAVQLEELATNSGMDLLRLRQIILDCDESVGSDGGCQCTRTIAAIAQSEKGPLEREIERLKQEVYHSRSEGAHWSDQAEEMHTRSWDEAVEACAKIAEACEYPHPQDMKGRASRARFYQENIKHAWRQAVHKIAAACRALRKGE